MINFTKHFKVLPVAAMALSGLTILPAAPISQDFPVTAPLHIPGAVLQPGTYSIHEVDHLKDRYILQVQTKDGQTIQTFIAIPNPSLSHGARSGPVVWPGSGSEHYVRGWAFPGEKAVLEFAYPKADAVDIARQDKAQVPAVDPQSENMTPPANATVSPTDMQVITLWMLSAEKVGPGNEQAAIKAVKYQAGDASAERKPVNVAARLPKTASEMPAVLMAGLLALAGAAFIRFARKSNA